MEGGITVSKVTTGTHLIRDIQVQVAHKEMTFIPMNQVNMSADLHKALGAKELFQLSSVVMPYKAEEVSPPPKAMVESAAPTPSEVENRLLKETVVNLQKGLAVLEAKLDQVLELLKRGSPSVVSVSSPSVKPVVEDDVVQIAVPMFIPDIETKEVVGSITTTSEESDGSSISGAASKLRELRSRNR